MGLVRKMVGGKKKKAGLFARVRRMNERAREQGQRQDPEPVPGNETLRPANAPLRTNRGKGRSLLKSKTSSKK